MGIIIGFFMLGLIGLGLPGAAQAGNITLAWNANSDPDIAGYKVYYGTGSRDYGVNLTVGNFTSCVVSGLTAGKTYYFAATAYNTGGQQSDYSTEMSYTVPAAPSPSTDGPTSFAVNAGGPKYTSVNGTVYSADTGFSSNSNFCKFSTSTKIAGTSDVALYQSLRYSYGNFSYNIPLSSGNYNLTLKFVEPTAKAAGQRVFDVLVGDKVVISRLDLYAVAGQNKAYDVKVPVSVTSGTLTIQFRSVKACPLVCALMVAK